MVRRVHLCNHAKDGWRKPKDGLEVCPDDDCRHAIPHSRKPNCGEGCDMYEDQECIPLKKNTEK